MTTYLVFATAAWLAGGDPVAVAQAVTAQQGRLNAAHALREICYLLALGEAQLDLTACLSLANGPELPFRTEVCSFLREAGQLRDFKFTSHADCVRHGFGR